MQLTLKVNSFQKGALGQGSSKVFADRGGTVGRVKDNDWVLPDPERIISSRHAVVQFKGGGFYLTDTSANGTFLNGSSEPIGNGNQVPLSDGDRLVIGDYEIAVDVTGATAGIDIPDADSAPRGGGFDRFDDAYDSVSGSPQQGVASEGPLDPLALLGGGSGGGAGAASGMPDDVWGAGDDDFSPSQGAGIPDDAFAPSRGGGIPDDAFAPPREGTPVDDGFAPSQEGSLRDDLASPSQAFTPPAASVEAIPEDWDLSGDDLMPSGAAPPPAPEAPPEPPEREPEPPPAPRPPRPRPARPPASSVSQDAPTEIGRPAAPAPPEAPPAPRAAASAAGGNAAAAFLRGAGLPADSVSPEQADEFMETAGEMFRECVTDLREVLLARASLKSGFRMEQTMIRPAENNPLKFAAGGADEAMQNLLFRRGSSYLPPLRAVSEGFQDIKDHQMAMMAGMQAAFRALLERFDPERLERRFEKTGGWSLLDVQKRSDYWSKFGQEYAEVKEQAEEDFQNLFGVDFTRAYEAQIRKLAKARKKS